MSPKPTIEVSLEKPIPSVCNVEIDAPGPAYVRLRPPDKCEIVPGRGATKIQLQNDGDSFLLSVNAPNGNAKVANDYPIMVVDTQGKTVASTTVRVTPKGKGDELSDDA